MFIGEVGLLDSKAITKIQSIILIAIIIIAAVGIGVTYVLLSEEGQSSETIKIGVLTDLDGFIGKTILQGIILAAEQINAEGGIAGKQIEVIGADTDIESAIADPAVINSALTRLMTFHNVDFIVGMAASKGFMVQESIAQHKKIFFEIGSTDEEYTQRVLDDYDSGKYFFRVTANATTAIPGITGALLHLKELTSLSKIGFLAENLAWTEGIPELMDAVLPELGFNVVYKGNFPPFETMDFSSYFAQAEAAGVEVLMPLIGVGNGIAFIKEYHDRQSPMVIYGGILPALVAGAKGWVNTDGKCEFVSVSSSAVDANYPLTSRTLPFREAYMERWSEIPDSTAAISYTVLRYILTDAVGRAGTLEVDAVINALETACVETPNAKNFVFTTSHEMMLGDPNDPDSDYPIAMLFQWQNGEMVPIFPKRIMEEAGATYTFPDWPGPWD
jgi:branched-chain amino acid transport system substrate-binding protein